MEEWSKKLSIKITTQISIGNKIRGSMSLLNEIQNDALDSSVDITSLLRKCMVLAAKLGNKEFQEWINHELYGYHENEDLPDYRIIMTASYGHFTTGGGMWQNLPISYYPISETLFKEVATVYFAGSISSLEHMVKNAKGASLQFPWNPDLISILRHKLYEDYTCISAYRQVSVSSIVEILSTVRTKVLEFVLEIQKKAPDAGEASFDTPPLPQEQVKQIVYNIIMGDVQNLATGSSAITQLAQFTQSTYEIHLGDWDYLVECLTKLGIGTPELEELNKAMYGDKTEEDHESIGERTKEWIKGAAEKVTSGTGAISITVASELILKAISAYLGIPS